MSSRFDEIGTLFLKRRKELGLTQEQVGEMVGVSKSEISKIENGRGLTFSTINKLSDALGVEAIVALEPRKEPSKNVIHFIVMYMGVFARTHKLSRKEACNYLTRNKELKFSIDNCEAEKRVAETYSDPHLNTFEFLVEYITARVVEWIIGDEKLSLENALLQFHNSETFEKLCERKTDMYIESPAYIYEIYKEEQRRGTLRGMTE